jgi:hypothetical protein
MTYKVVYRQYNLEKVRRKVEAPKPVPGITYSIMDT